MPKENKTFHEKIGKYREIYNLSRDRVPKVLGLDEGIELLTPWIRIRPQKNYLRGQVPLPKVAHPGQNARKCILYAFFIWSIVL